MKQDESELHQALVDCLKREGLMGSPRVEAAFRAVPRHLFLPGVELDRVYSDEAIPTKFSDGQAISSSSQPAVMAIMLEQLELERGHHVLEIGAGTGYNAALMAHLVGETGRVVTLDIDEDIVTDARAHLAAAGFERAQVVCADGGFGFADCAPYDRIILTVSSGEIAPAWREQLKPSGRLVLPLAIQGPQKSAAFQKADGHLVSVSLRECGFMSLRGVFAEPENFLELGPEPCLRLFKTDLSQVEAESVYRLLTGPSQDRPTGVRATPREIWASLHLWLALHEPGLCGLSAEGPWAERGLVPFLIDIGGKWKICSTGGLLSQAGLSVLMRPPDQVPFMERPADTLPFEILVRTFGADGALGQRLIDHVRAWDEAGRPSSQGLRIRAYPLDSDYAPAEGEWVVTKRWTRLVLDWSTEDADQTRSRLPSVD